MIDSSKYISAFKRSFLTMMLLTALDIYMANSHYAHQYELQVSEVLETMYAATQAVPQVNKLPSLNTTSLATIYADIGLEILEKSTAYLKSIIEGQKNTPPIVPPLPQGLNDTYATVGFLENLRTPLQPFLCSAAVYRGSKKTAQIAVNTWSIGVDSFFSIPYDGEYLLNISWKCSVAKFGLTNIILVDGTSREEVG